MKAPELSRELTGKIVQDLARATRSTSAIASRHHVPVATVQALRDHYGPDVQNLIAAAEELRRPLTPPAEPSPEPARQDNVPPAPAPAPEPRLAVDDKRGLDGLTGLERCELRAWASATGREVASAGRIAAVLVQEWEEAGRPVVAGDGVVEAVVIEEAPVPLTEQPAAQMLRDEFFLGVDALVAVLPYASVHLREMVEDFVRHMARVTDEIGTHQLEHDMVEAAAQTLYQLALQDLLPADVVKLRDAARVVLAAVHVVPPAVV